MQHGLFVKQRVEQYTDNSLKNIKKEIEAGWRVVTMTATPVGNIYVVYERVITACGTQVTCLSCIAES